MAPWLIKDRIAAFVGVAAAQLSDDVRLADAVTESFRVVELIIGMQEDLGFRLSSEALRDVVTVGDLVKACVASPAIPLS